jgi:hypothetical protein
MPTARELILDCFIFVRSRFEIVIRRSLHTGLSRRTRSQDSKRPECDSPHVFTEYQ